ncbi:hypothetical protein ACN4EG_02680 [Alkalinema pantanalense CENA528]|uniref:hypothetical protein n=1 Tax=Alkalinema pantanalense TaxID=1620705 RepID=UPI003D7021D4
MTPVYPFDRTIESLVGDVPMVRLSLFVSVLIDSFGLICFDLTYRETFDSPMSTTLFTTLEVAAALLLAGITGGVIYITAADWRDRRRRENETKR